MTEVNGLRIDLHDADCGAMDEDGNWLGPCQCAAVDHKTESDQCVCDPEGPCLGVPGESDACGACLVLDPEEPCLHDPDLCTCARYVVDHSDPEPHHPENLDREDDPDCPVHRVVTRPVHGEVSRG